MHTFDYNVSVINERNSSFNFYTKQLPKVLVNEILIRQQYFYYVLCAQYYNCFVSVPFVVSNWFIIIIISSRRYPQAEQTQQQAYASFLAKLFGSMRLWSRFRSRFNLLLYLSQLVTFFKVSAFVLSDWSVSATLLSPSALPYTYFKSDRTISF